MSRCRVDRSIERVVIAGFAFPLGVYPVSKMTPRQGYTLAYEAADAGEEPEAESPDEGDLEEWPDRYVFDIAISATRLEPLCRALFAMMPGRIYPILDVLGYDAYREIDPYVTYELIGQERFTDAVRRFRAFFYEDGLVGFGAMSLDPFIYVFIDEHKLVTVRAEPELKERIEAVLHAFDLEEVDSIAGADATVHEHRGVLEAPDDRADLLTQDEIVEHLCDEWGLILNVDPLSNTDDEGRELGITGWRCLVRTEHPEDLRSTRYAEVYLTASCLSEADALALSAVERLLDDEPTPSRPSNPHPAPIPGSGSQQPTQPGGSGEGPGAEEQDPATESSEEEDLDDSLEKVVVAAERLRPAELIKATSARGGPEPDPSISDVWAARWIR